jgi:hypothetical protein
MIIHLGYTTDTGSSAFHRCYLGELYMLFLSRTLAELDIRHPGGAKAILAFAGQASVDASTQYASIHDNVNS